MSVSSNHPLTEDWDNQVEAYQKQSDRSLTFSADVSSMPSPKKNLSIGEQETIQEESTQNDSSDLQSQHSDNETTEPESEEKKDEKKDDDDEENWVEFRSATNDVLYYNATTRVVTRKPPPAILKANELRQQNQTDISLSNVMISGAVPPSPRSAKLSLNVSCMNSVSNFPPNLSYSPSQSQSQSHSSSSPQNLTSPAYANNAFYSPSPSQSTRSIKSLSNATPVLAPANPTLTHVNSSASIPSISPCLSPSLNSSTFFPAPASPPLMPSNPCAIPPIPTVSLSMGSPVNSNGSVNTVSSTHSDGKPLDEGAIILEEWTRLKKRPQNPSAIDTEGSPNEKVSNWLSLIERTVEQILGHAESLSSAACEELRQVKTQVKNVQQSCTVDDRDDVTALLEFDKLHWNFNNDYVDSYRAGAIRFSHNEFEYKNWHMPLYYSDFPLPPLEKNVIMTVKLPEGSNPALASTRVSVTATDTVNRIIHLVLQSKLKTESKMMGIENEYVLKAQGLKEYMEGENLLFSYAYVRKTLRDGGECFLTMMKRPLPEVDTNEKSFNATLNYMKRVDTKVHALGITEFQGLSNANKIWDQIQYIPMHDVQLPFRLMIVGIENCVQSALPRLKTAKFTCDEIFIETFLFHGIEKIKESEHSTRIIALEASPRWKQWLGGITPTGAIIPETIIANLPRGTRLGILVYGRQIGVVENKGKVNEPKRLLVGWSVVPLIDHHGKLVQGEMNINLWPIHPKAKARNKKRHDETLFIYKATTRQNDTTRGEKAVLRIQFDSYSLPIVAALVEEPREPNPMLVGLEMPTTKLSSADQKMFEMLMSTVVNNMAHDSLEKLNAQQKKAVWMWRHHLTKYPHLLPKFLQSVDWSKRECVHEAHRLMYLWNPPLHHVSALELLDARYPDYRVREYAVSCLSRMKDSELSLYLLQLVQCLKFETYHYSPLARFLIERSLQNPLEIGHHFFWHLKAELHVPEFCERFTLILEEYLSYAGHYTEQLRKQFHAVIKMQKVAEMVVRLKRNPDIDDDAVKTEYIKELDKLNRDFFGPIGKFLIPFNPKLEATTLILNKCKYMSSKMVPLWLVFQNADPDGPPIYILFKSGDDLRQDILTLQMLRVMDKIWLLGGLDMRLKPYSVIATGVNDHGEGVGMLEVVTNSDTTSNIQWEYGGGASGAFKDTTIVDYLHHHNREGHFDRAVENFVRSCAGYCVATYVLGIGDRHNGNIMVTKDGHLFHIDFGHFLGNFKQKFGINRERAAFVFTPEMAYVMGGTKDKTSKDFLKFMDLARNAFKVLRQNTNILENLFILMVSAGMPELMVEADIAYLRDKLALEKTEKESEKLLEEEIYKSLDSTYRRFDNYIHNVKHATKPKKKKKT